MQDLPKAPIEVSVLLFERFSNHCLANAVEPLRAANMLAGVEHYRWRFLTPDGAAVCSSSGLPVQPFDRLGREAGGDYLLLLPSYGFRAEDRPDMRRALRAAAGRHATLVGLDTGAWLMASAGLLDGRPATIHWDEHTAFAESFPYVEARPERFVIDGDRITCGGASATFELMTLLIRRHLGAALALQVSTLFLQGDWQRPRVPTGPGRAGRAVALMRRNLESPLSVPRLAQIVGMSQRALTAQMRAQFGMTPREIYQALRLEAARRYLTGSDMAVAEIAARCGWTDQSAFARAFRRHFAATPVSVRGHPRSRTG
ncbi:MAG: GlxA family transcriptional regulator [Pseudomonadota bacterium]